MSGIFSFIGSYRILHLTWFDFFLSMLGVVALNVASLYAFFLKDFSGGHSAGQEVHISLEKVIAD